MTDISKITTPDGTSYNIKDANAIANISISEGVMTVTKRDNSTTTQNAITSHLYAGSGTAANSATSNGNTKLTIVDDTTVRNNVSLVGAGGVRVRSDASGTVTISWADLFDEVTEENVESIINGTYTIVTNETGTGDDSFDEVTESDITTIFS